MDLSQYKNLANNWYPKEKDLYANITDECRTICREKETALKAKWLSFIPPRWYGFGLGSPCPLIWYQIIDEFLEYLLQLQKENKITNLRILQIKIKFGGLRFYVDFDGEEEIRKHLKSQIAELEEILSDEKLIY